MKHRLSEGVSVPGPGASKRRKLGDQGQLREALLKITHQNATSSLLLRLPAEIRNMVFDYVFYEIYHIDTRGQLLEKPSGYYSGYGYQPSLLLVSRQLYRETASLPYKLAVFHLGRHPWGPADLCDIEVSLQRRSKAQIEVMAQVTCHDHDTHTYGGEMTGTGAYWTEYLRLV